MDIEKVTMGVISLDTADNVGAQRDFELTDQRGQDDDSQPQPQPGSKNVPSCASSIPTQS